MNDLLDDPWLGLPAREEDLRAIRALVGKLGYNPICLEVGSYVGRSALAMIEGGALRAYCVDSWSGGADRGDLANNLYDLIGGHEVFRRFLANTRAHLLSRIIPVQGLGAFWAEQWPDDFPLDLVYIDAAHDAGSVAGDIEAWTRRVRSGGILAGHDYSTSWPGVVEAVKASGPFEVFPDSTVWWRRIS